MSRVTVVKGLAAAVSLAVIGSLIGAALVLGSPTEQRQRRLDEQRLENLWNISSSIQGYARKHDAIPQDLTALEEYMRAEA